MYICVCVSDQCRESTLTQSPTWRVLILHAARTFSKRGVPLALRVAALHGLLITMKDVCMYICIGLV